MNEAMVKEKVLNFGDGSPECLKDKAKELLFIFWAVALRERNLATANAFQKLCGNMVGNVIKTFAARMELDPTSLRNIILEYSNQANEIASNYQLVKIDLSSNDKLYKNDAWIENGSTIRIDALEYGAKYIKKEGNGN